MSKTTKSPVTPQPAELTDAELMTVQAGSPKLMQNCAAGQHVASHTVGADLLFGDGSVR